MRARHSIVSLFIATALLSPALSVAARAQTRTFDLPSRSATDSIADLARQADAQILVEEGLARGITTNAVTGSFTVDEALGRLLRETPLDWVRTGPNSYSIRPREDMDSGATPDILVQGRREWTLNTGIKRTENDSQPFIVIDGEQIRKSGAPDLETYLRNSLSVNSAGSTAEQPNIVDAPNRSTINLRGLGERETLILIDGRRLAGTSNSDGNIGQPTIVGIPLAAIERIEVLASSASGIYGNGATGGVINIIMRRDYRGAEASVTYSDTFAGGGRGIRADLTGGLSLEGGKTNVTFSASYNRTDPVLFRDRAGLIVDSRRQAFANSPIFFRFNPPLGATPNLGTGTAQPLQLDDRFGGTILSSPNATVPVGFRGIGQDGVAGLLATAGTYNLDLSDNSAANGGRRELLLGVEQFAGSVAARRDFNDWLKVYAELSYTRAGSPRRADPVPSTIKLAADAPNNPFAQDIFVTVPFVGVNNRVLDRTLQSYRGVLGGIVKLPGSWQAVVDYSRSRNTTDADDTPPRIALDSLAEFQDGTQDILRDVRLAPPLSYRYLDIPYGSSASQTRNDIANFTVRLAGPLPVRLPGGKPTVTLSAERSTQRQARDIFFQNDAEQSTVRISEPGRQRIDAAYGEINLPILGEGHHLPLIRDLLVTVSGRFERYSETGSPYGSCYAAEGLLPSLDITTLCPIVPPSATTRQSRFDPSLSLRWRPVDGVTLRTSYATGYLTPRLSDLVKITEPRIYTSATDSQRGNEQIGTEDLDSPGNYFVPGSRGGNADVAPETSKTLTAGIILQPAFIPGLRLSADWTRIRKRNNYANPDQLLFPSTVEQQAAFDAFLARYPQRVTRGPASGGFAVGPITSIDASLANLVGSISESIDFAGSYTRPLFGGGITLDARATYVKDLSLQVVPGGANENYAGVITGDFLFLRGGFGAMRWKGAGSLQWTGDRLTLIWQTRFFDSYFVSLDRQVSIGLGAAKVPSQTYHDISGSYAFANGLKLRATVNNVFNKRPPLDTSNASFLYSTFGDPRLANYQLTVSKSF